MLLLGNRLFLYVAFNNDVRKVLPCELIGIMSQQTCYANRQSVPGSSDGN